MYFCPVQQMMEYLLHIDTSGATGMVAITANGEVLAVQRNKAEREHAASINRMIGAVMEEAGILLGNLAAVAVCSGPGSYTGLRIGLATAKGLCYALDKPLLLHDKLELLAGNATAGIAMISLPARTGEYFISIFQDKCRNLLTPQHQLTADVLRIMNEYNVEEIVGMAADDLLSQAPNLLYTANDAINPAYWGILAMQAFGQKAFADLAHAEPLYLKPVYIHKKSA